MSLPNAQAIGLIGSTVLWQGQVVTLVQVRDTKALVNTQDSSQIVDLSELELAQKESKKLLSTQEHFLIPKVFHPQPSELACMPRKGQEVPQSIDDPSLNACFDPTTEQGLEDSLRQIASQDPEKKKVGREAVVFILKQGRGGRRRVEEAIRELEAGQENSQETTPEFVDVREVKAWVKKTAVALQTTSVESGSGEQKIVSPADPIVTSAAVVVASSVSDPISLVDIPQRVVFGGLSLRPENDVIDISEKPVERVRSASVVRDSAPVVIPRQTETFSVTIPLSWSAADEGILLAPPRESRFFQVLFARQDISSSVFAQFLTQPVSEQQPAIERIQQNVRRATWALLREYRLTLGLNPLSLRGLDHTATLTFAYDPKRAGVEIRLNTPHAIFYPDTESIWDYAPPFGHRSLVSVPMWQSLQTRVDREIGLYSVFVPIPISYLLAGQTIDHSRFFPLASHSGHATDRAVERSSRRSSSDSDHSGRERQGGGREGSRDGQQDQRDQRRQHRQHHDSEGHSVAA